jgi:hypothetical protein
MMAFTLSDMINFLESAPRDLLLVMRATNLVRSLNRDLGGTAMHRFAVRGRHPSPHLPPAHALTARWAPRVMQVMANTAVRGIYEKDTGEARSWADYVRFTVASASVRWRLFWIQTAAAAAQWWTGFTPETAMQDIAVAVAGKDSVTEQERKMIEQAMLG